MVPRLTIVVWLVWSSVLLDAHGQAAGAPVGALAFEVATIKPVDHDARGGRFIVMQGVNRFVEKDYTLRLLIAEAYDLNPKAILGGARGWTRSATTFWR